MNAQVLVDNPTHIPLKVKF